MELSARTTRFAGSPVVALKSRIGRFKAVRKDRSILLVEGLEMSHPSVMIERMFGNGDWDSKGVDLLETRVLARQAQISRLWAEQVADLRELDRFQVDTAQGHRTMADWVSSRLDLSHQTATRLMTITRADDPEIDNLATGVWGLDRAACCANSARRE